MSLHVTYPGKSRPGMTLIEIIVVLTIVAAMMAMAAYSLATVTDARLRGAALRLSGTITHIFGRSAINGTRYQLVIDLDTNEYWAECSEVEVPLGMEMTDAREHDAAAEESATEGEESSGSVMNTNHRRRWESDDDEADPFGLNLQNTFDDCTEDLIPRRTLPDGLEFDSVMTTHQTDPFESGQATIAFFSNGFVEQSIIWLRETDGEGAMTLLVHSMTGRVTIVNGHSDIPDDFLEVQEDR
jgi:prepilin-type N-terminal cleavage/methylation domain-containing protein